MALLEEEGEKEKNIHTVSNIGVALIVIGEEREGWRDCKEDGQYHFGGRPSVASIV